MRIAPCAALTRTAALPSPVALGGALFVVHKRMLLRQDVTGHVQSLAPLKFAFGVFQIVSRLLLLQRLANHL